ncbi:MAG: T9SS type A sorting domain-containing protein [Bacteroidales bacterium]|nr:T9SS type A sorting domain-containing protein [Bacteroidales bacterium]
MTANTSNGGPNLDKMEVSGLNLKSAGLISQSGNEVEEKVLVYPNPISDGIVTVANIRDYNNLRIIGVDGRIVLNKQLIGESNVQLEKPSKVGLYLIVLSNNSKTDQFKLIVK